MFSSVSFEQERSVVKANLVLKRNDRGVLAVDDVVLSAFLNKNEKMVVYDRINLLMYFVSIVGNIVGDTLKSLS
jgi:hypothetical protein